MLVTVPLGGWAWTLSGGQVANVYTGELSYVEDVALISYSTPRVPNLTLLAPLRALGLRVETIGDCRMPRGVADLIRRFDKYRWRYFAENVRANRL